MMKNKIVIIGILVVFTLISTVLTNGIQPKTIEKKDLQEEIIINRAPNRPSRPIGLIFCKKGVLYPYTSRATDPDRDRIHYSWECSNGWGMSTVLYESGERCRIWYSWNESGVYKIRVQAMDEHYTYSEWSKPLPILVFKGRKN